MKRKFHTPEQIVKKLREADAIIASGNTVDQACRKLEISDATYYNRRNRTGPIRRDLLPPFTDSGCYRPFA